MILTGACGWCVCRAGAKNTRKNSCKSRGGRRSKLRERVQLVDVPSPDPFSGHPRPSPRRSRPPVPSSPGSFARSVGGMYMPALSLCVGVSSECGCHQPLALGLRRGTLKYCCTCTGSRQREPGPYPLLEVRYTRSIILAGNVRTASSPYWCLKRSLHFRPEWCIVTTLVGGNGRNVLFVCVIFSSFARSHLKTVTYD